MTLFYLLPEISFPSSTYFISQVAEITGLDLDLIKRCNVVLRTLSCGYAVNVERFREYAVVTASVAREVGKM